jgi:hypothetical protein
VPELIDIAASHRPPSCAPLLLLGRLYAPLARMQFESA